jgi:hypothetical protein
MVKLELGALYSRRDEIHRWFGGQSQSGICTPSGHKVILLFTGASGLSHGYADYADEKGFHIYGEGQSGDMQFTRGNRALRDHEQDGKKLLLFQALGKGHPVRYLGEHHLVSTREEMGADGIGRSRKVIVFTIRRTSDDEQALGLQLDSPDTRASIDLASTTSQQLVVARTKQGLFRNRLLLVENRCRVTGIDDLRFLRASHIKPWARCETGDERVDGNNGLLLATHIDHLFDQGWISFKNDGSLIVSDLLPKSVIQAMPLAMELPIRPFNTDQRSYLHFHRFNVLRKRSFDC